jgi:hypothetical protein
LRFEVNKISPSPCGAANLAGCGAYTAVQNASKAAEKWLARGLLWFKVMMTYDPVRKTMVAMPPYGRLRTEAPKPAENAVTDLKVADAKAAPEEEDFFDHLWDVVNPLQHLPVIGTIYRAATGDRLDPVEKIAGGTLYGGLWGAVGAVASLAFESLTGRSVEDTVMAWLDGDDKAAPTRVAAANISPKLSPPSGDLPDLANADLANADMAPGAPDTQDMLALTGAMTAKGVDGDIANRALYAYRRSMNAGALYTPVTASLH